MYSRQPMVLGVLGILLLSANVRSAEMPGVSFEDAQGGVVKELSTDIGVWRSVVGLCVVDDKHARTGTKCLQLSGGEQTSVTLEFAEGVETSGDLTFWAERWTSRGPFSFRIEKKTKDGWVEIFDGDKSVRVGRSFLNPVRVPLRDPSIRQLRFRCTSPPDTGVLIDDVRMSPLEPQKIVSMEVVPVTLPVLIGKDASPLAMLKVETTGQLDPISILELCVTLKGTTSITDLSELTFHFHGGDTAFPAAKKVGTVDSQQLSGGAKRIPFLQGSCQLAEGTNSLWIACKLDSGANIDHTISVLPQQVSFSNGQTTKLQAFPSVQRMGIAVRNGGDDGVHTYRIPGLATTNNGTLIGVYDVRRRSGGDLPGDIDVGMSRSTDGGRTWETMQIIMDMGNDPKWRYDGIGDPAVLVDRKTGSVWVAATWSHGDRSWNGSGPGSTPEETGQLMLVRSDDDGVTWSQPINITQQVKRPEWCFLLQGPGKGITMRDGTIVFAAQYQDPQDQGRLPHSTIIYSKDHGESWQAGTGAFDDTTEAQVVESEPGVLMLNCRYNRKEMRVVMTTRDLGQNWQKHPTSEHALIEPGACMASLIDVGREGNDTTHAGWLLFSNPDSTAGRHHLTIKASRDRGLTWPPEHRLLLDEGKSAGYSCLSMIDDQTVGILYEGSQAHMTFQRIPLVDFQRGDQAQDAPPAQLNPR